MILLQHPTSTPEDPGGPTQVPPEPVAFPLRLSWSAPWLGRSWEISDSTAAILHVVGATGLGPAPVAHAWSESPTIHGSTWERLRFERMPVTLPLLVAGDSSVSFLDEHAAFMAACDPYRLSVLRVTRPDGAWREIECRYSSGLSDAFERDPVFMMQAAYVVEWVAGDPFWRGAEVVASFPYVTPPAFFPGPPWSLAPNRSLSSASVTNPGDVDSFPVWRVDGPLTSFSVGIGSAVVSFGAALTAGQWVEIDMRPGKKTIRDQAGVLRNDDATAWNDSPIPPGDSTLVTSLANPAAGSAATLTFTPRYRAAW